METGKKVRGRPGAAGDGGEGSGVRRLDVRQESAAGGQQGRGLSLPRPSHRRWAPGCLQLGVEELAQRLVSCYNLFCSPQKCFLPEMSRLVS